MFEIFLGVDIWSYLCWVGVPFFDCCCHPWILGKCGSSGVSGREYEGVWRDGDKRVSGTLGPHREVESPMNGIGVIGRASASRLEQYSELSLDRG